MQAENFDSNTLLEGSSYSSMPCTPVKEYGGGSTSILARAFPPRATQMSLQLLCQTVLGE